MVASPDRTQALDFLLIILVRHGHCGAPTSAYSEGACHRQSCMYWLTRLPPGLTRLTVDLTNYCTGLSEAHRGVWFEKLCPKKGEK